jgi:hypothetical protein
MKVITQLQLLLGRYFTSSYWNLECLSHIILGLLQVNDVNLAKLAKTFSREASVDSCYKRLQRFMKRFTFSFDQLWLLINHTFDLTTTLYLTMDRTNWKFGKTHINFLVIGVAFNGYAIPIIWRLLPNRKRGNSTALDREELFDCLRKFICLKNIRSLLCDREFIDHNWLNYLIKHQIPFAIRVKLNLTVNTARGKVKVSHLFRNLKVYDVSYLKKAHNLVDCKVYLSAMRLASGELLIVATESYNQNALDDYAVRWEIESCFSALKKRGFNLENTHLTSTEKLVKIMFIAVIAFIWSYACGELLIKTKNLKVKKHGYYCKSIIKIGIEAIGKAISRIHININQLVDLIYCLGETIEKQKIINQITGVL